MPQPPAIMVKLTALLFLVSLTVSFPNRGRAASARRIPSPVQTSPNPETTEERTIQPGRTDAYRVTLTEGLALPIVVRCFGADLEVAVWGSGESLLSKAESYLGENAVIRTVFIPKTSGSYDILIRHKPDVAVTGPGKYVIRIFPQRPPAVSEFDPPISRLGEARALIERDQCPDALKVLAPIGPELAPNSDRIAEHQILQGFANLKLERITAGHALLFAGFQTFSKLKEPAGQLFCMRALARSRSERGSHRIALEWLKFALPLYQAGHGRPLDHATAISEVGDNLSRLGDFEGAINHKGEAVVRFKKLGNHHLATQAVAELAAVQSAAGQFDAAVKNYREILAGDHFPPRVQAGYWLDFAEAVGKSSFKTEAGEAFRTASARFHALGLSENEIDALLRLGTFLLKVDDLPNAEMTFQNALALSRRIGKKPLEASALLGLARVTWKKGDPDLALRHCDAALARVEVSRKDLSSEDERVAFGESSRIFYETRCGILLDLSRTFPDRGYVEESLLTIERSRARALVETLHSKELLFRIEPGTEAADLANWASTVTLFNQLRVGSWDPTSSFFYEGSRDDTLADFFGVLKKPAAPSLRFRRLEEAAPLSWPDVGQLSDPDTVILEYAFLEDRTALWLMTDNRVDFFSLPPGSVIEPLARKVHSALAERGNQTRFEKDHERRKRLEKADAAYESASRQLASLLFPFPISRISGKRLVVVGDGALHFLPFAALPLPGPGKFLLSECEITQLPALGALKQIREDSARRPPPAQTVAIFADPVFSPTDGRIKRPSGKPSATPPGNRRAAETVFDDRGSVFGRLPYSKVEADAILALIPSEQGVLFQGFEATRGNFTRLNSGQFRFLHFATHATVDTTRPDLSTIALTLVGEDGQFPFHQKDRNPVRGFVQSFEVFNLNVQVDMVVLSGCRTGLGKEIRGEGVIGLSRSFMIAGASRVLASLWAVQDESTSTLMADVYGGMLGPKKLRPSAALREAQLKMMKNPRWAAPYYWAAFTIQGEPR